MREPAGTEELVAEAVLVRLEREFWEPPPGDILERVERRRHVQRLALVYAAAKGWTPPKDEGRLRRLWRWWTKGADAKVWENEEEGG